MNDAVCGERAGGLPGAAEEAAIVGAMNRYPRRETVSMKRGWRASSFKTVRSSLMTVFKTDSLTNW
jgi:hypothetical protein